MKINKLLVIALLGYSLIAFCGCGGREIKNIDSKGKNIICFGDSLTFGYGVNEDEDYPAVLDRMLDIPVFNAGIDGDTTIEAVKRLNSDVLDKDPLLVIIEFSGNDFLRKIPKEVTLSNIRVMTERIQARRAMVAIVDISTSIFLSEYRSVLRNLAREKRAIFIPSVLNGIITNPSMKSDFLHPNANGYQMIAQRIQRAITPYLKKNSALIKKEK